MSEEKVIRKTKQRELILGLLDTAEGPISATAIVDSAKREIPTLNKSTVYRTLDRLEREGEVLPVKALPGVVHYERTSASHHHHHFVCQGCQEVFCIEGCPGGIAKLLPEGFSLESHEISLYGLCRECNAPKKKATRKPDRNKNTGKS